MDVPTRATLLYRLRSAGSDRDWESFYHLYSGPIFGLARQFGLPPAQAEEVVQETMVILMRELPGFSYDPERGRFRTWLWQVVRNALRSALRREKRQSGQREIGEAADAETSNQSFGPRPSSPVPPAAVEPAEFWRLELLAQALQLLSEDPRASPRDLAVFHAVTLEERAPKDVAEEHGITRNHVDQIKNTMKRRLKKHMDAIEAGQAGDFRD